MTQHLLRLLCVQKTLLIAREHVLENLQSQSSAPHIMHENVSTGKSVETALRMLGCIGVETSHFFTDFPSSAAAPHLAQRATVIANYITNQYNHS